jgi:hypothetical protein
MTTSKSVPPTIEKIMSIRLVEFEAGLTRLDPAAPSTNVSGTYQIPNTDGASITFEKIEPAVLGGLMRLPRARVTLHVETLDQEARTKFLAFFDQTFQRGGG